jgi:hypothetical protein
MCLFVNKKLTRRARQRKGFVIRYKVLKTDVRAQYFPGKGEGTYINRHGVYSPVWSKAWRSGFNRCDLRRKPKDIPRKVIKIDNGIHVYKIRKHAIQQWESNMNHYNLVVVPVKCYVEDLMGADSDEEVYFKVFLEKEDYEKARKRDKSVAIVNIHQRVKNAS